MDRIERIMRMEQILDKASETIKKLSDSLEAYEQLEPAIRELETYYSSGEWQRDFEADCAGLLPKDLKRGVLSEDAVYDLFTDIQQLRREANALLCNDKGGTA